MIKEIIFFSLGDSNKISTWSNVPYLFSKELEKKGIIVHRINIEPNQAIRYRYNAIIHKIYNLIWPGNIYYYERSLLFYYITNHKIKKAVRQFPNADICIFCTFSFYNKFSNIPSLLFCDWSFNQLICERLNRKPSYIENEFIKREHDAIFHAEFVVSLFPECAKKLKEDNPSSNIHYLGKNVVNSVYNEKMNEKEILINKNKRKTVLFIGNQNNPTYLKTAQIIAKSFLVAKKTITNLELHIIGIESPQLGMYDSSIYCYGYLHKENDQECEIYYNLLLHSSLIINTTPLWAGYSSIIEAMYFYTPIIVYPFKDFVKEFGATISFGKYNSSNNVNDISIDICDILTSSHYTDMARTAHLQTKDYSWENYVNKLFNLIDSPVSTKER